MLPLYCYPFENDAANIADVRRACKADGGGKLAGLLFNVVDKCNRTREEEREHLISRELLNQSQGEKRR